MVMTDAYAPEVQASELASTAVAVRSFLFIGVSPQNKLTLLSSNLRANLPQDENWRLFNWLWDTRETCIARGVKFFDTLFCVDQSMTSAPVNGLTAKPPVAESKDAFPLSLECKIPRPRV
jgi:hypothetical protein